MRVWALASCGGLLALAACSAEQPQSTQADLPSPLDEDAAQVNALSSAVLPPSRSVETPQARLERLRPTTTPLAAPAAPTAERRPSASPQALRARVQQLRSQAVTVPSPVMPLVNPVAVPPAPEKATAVNSGAPTVTALAVATPQITPLPTAASSVAVDPGFAHGGWDGIPVRYGTDAIADPVETLNEPAAVALSPTQPASLGPSSLRHNRHQGYSTRLGRAPQLTPEVSAVARYSPPAVANRLALPSDHRASTWAGVNRLTPSQPLFPELVSSSTEEASPEVAAEGSPQVATQAAESNSRSPVPTNLETAAPLENAAELELQPQADGTDPTHQALDDTAGIPQNVAPIRPDQRQATIDPTIQDIAELNQSTPEDGSPAIAPEALPQLPPAAESPVIEEAAPDPVLSTQATELSGSNPNQPVWASDPAVAERSPRRPEPTVAEGRATPILRPAAPSPAAPSPAAPSSENFRPESPRAEASGDVSLDVSLAADHAQLGHRPNQVPSLSQSAATPLDRHWSSAPASLSLPLNPDTMTVPAPQFSGELDPDSLSHKMWSSESRIVPKGAASPRPAARVQPEVGH